ncbi:protein GDAP2 homolog [Macrosteles quadrilineatus]|uniref:protein GDAP2 homolog n=1 Tax=Macrosteles quadrilineatus TaxID=74068 RepID=UPI0023E1F1EC|nr:protein GDAP2 homolog [Macrosteles quadrilineatus]XP_054266040.1 protein GDAP2 homolog [Macrosteles quadrilineatus]
MDTLDSVGNDVVDPSDLTRWSQTKPHQHTFLYDQGGVDDKSPFPFDQSLNVRLILWSGDLTKLRVDAIVHSTNESFTDSTHRSHQLFEAAGPGLVDEITNEIGDCRTGEVKVTQGHQLPARYVIHTVGPLYNIRYQTAAESTLHTCYRNVLLKAVELKLKTLGLCVVNSVHRNYPPDEGAHIALRTIRRFLEKQQKTGVKGLDTIVLAVDSCDGGIYEVLMPLYFPRSPGEERAAVLQLPGVGGPDGEPLFPDRQIRIIDNPTHHHHHEEESSVIDLTSQLETDSVFSQMQGDLDQQRLLGERPIPSVDPFLVREIHNKERYERLLRRAKTEDLSEVSGIGCLYQSGHDRLGRPVIVFVGKWFRFKEINLDKALLYLIYLLDPLVKGDYVIAYFHTLTGNSNYPSFAWLREVYSILPYKYKKNLKAFYIIHPTFIWTKMMTWWFTTFMAPAIKQKVHCLPGVEYLYSAMSPNQLEIPAFITEYDMSVSRNIHN